MKMQQLDDLDRQIVTYWAVQHRQALVLPGQVFVEAAMHAALAQLRCYHTANDLLRWHDLRCDAALSLIGSLLPAMAADARWQVWCAALHLRWIELVGPRGALLDVKP